MQRICATGIRGSKLRFITVEAVRTGRATVSLKGKSRQVLIPSALRRELRHYIKERRIAAGPVFITKTGNSMDRSNMLHEMKRLFVVRIFSRSGPGFGRRRPCRDAMLILTVPHNESYEVSGFQSSGKHHVHCAVPRKERGGGLLREKHNETEKDPNHNN